MAKDNVSPLGSLEDISNACNELIRFNIDERVNKNTPPRAETQMVGYDCERREEGRISGSLPLLGNKTSR